MVRQSKRQLGYLYTGILLLLIFPAKAQNYFADFENISKTGYALDTLPINGLQWALREAVISNNASDLKNGQKSVRMRSSKGDTTFMTLVDHKRDGLGQLSFFYGRAAFSGDRNGLTPSLVTAYSVDSGQIWTTIDTFSCAGIDTLTFYQSDTLNIPGPILVRLTTTGGASGKRINVDDLQISSFVVVTNITLTHKTPVGPGILPEMDSLQLQFDHKIAVADGLLKLHRIGASQPQTIKIPSAQVQVRDSSVVIHDIPLPHASSFYVQLTAGSFTDISGRLPNTAIEDSITWTFSTADTSSARAISTLQESFSFCSDRDNRLASFQQFSTSGKRVWTCSPLGRDDSAAISMLGGIATDVSESNMDWLLSAAPFDLSATNQPTLSFWQKKRYEGHVQRDIRISTDYAGKGAPLDATWTVLEEQALTSDPANYWTNIEHISLSAYKQVPFYLAFTYSCSTEGAYELLYDDISIKDDALLLTPPGVRTTSLHAQIIGPAYPHLIHLGLSATEDMEIQLRLYELSGRPLYTKKIKIKNGQNEHLLQPTGLSPGFYLIVLENNQSKNMVKVLLQ